MKEINIFHKKKLPKMKENENNLNVTNNSSNCFNSDISNMNFINYNLLTLFECAMNDNFHNILCQEKEEFINIIEQKVKDSISEEYSNEKIEDILNNEKFDKIYKKNLKLIIEKYKTYKRELIDGLEEYVENKGKKDYFFQNFKKHCPQTGKYALHKCSKHIFGEYFIVYNKI